MNLLMMILVFALGVALAKHVVKYLGYVILSGIGALKIGAAIFALVVVLQHLLA